MELLVIGWNTAVTYLVCATLLHTCNTQFSPGRTSQFWDHETLRHDVSCNQVCEYDDWFQRAHCEERNLTKVPSSEGCEDTIILELQGNHLTFISGDSLMGYSLLRTLDMSHNTINTISLGAFLNTKYLKTILLNNNNITELLNRTFAGTENHLRRIMLSRNNIVNIHEHVFQGLKALTSIFLSYNKIQSLPSSIFHGLTRLQDIILGYNELHELDALTFRDLAGLETLSLRNNKLKWLPLGLFQGLSSLREVVLSNNELVMLPSPENLGITSISRLYIDSNNLTQSESIIPYIQITHDRLECHDNPITCDCAFILMQDWYNSWSEENVVEFSVTCTLKDFKYHLGDTLPISCEQPATNVKTTSEPKEDHTTSTVYHNNTDGQLSHGPGTSEVIPSTNDILPSNYYVCQRFQCNQYCKEDKADKIIFILSVYCAVCITVFFFSWIYFTIYYCCSSKQALT